MRSGIIKAHIIAAILLFFCALGKAQVSPFQGLGQVQFFDNSGAPLTNGVLYSFQAGTSTQQATFTDSTGLIQNVNPITFGSGARVGIWLTTTAFYKFVLCVQNDGAFCSAGDILFSVDNVPGGSSGGGGGGCGATCTSIFISSTASPATSGALRLASGDSICWRNAAGSANLCFKKDSNDLLSWDGGSFKLPEVGAPAGLAGFDILWADNTAHRLKAVNNAGTAAQYVLSGNDIGTTDQVLGVHFNATQEIFCNTAPTTGQFLQFSGTCIGGGSVASEATLAWCSGFGNTSFSGCVPVNAFNESSNSGWGTETFFTNAHTIIRFTYNLGASPVTCATSPVIGVRDVTSSTTLTSATVANGATTGFVDSGALSIAITAGHKIMIGIITSEAGCGTNAVINNVMMVYQ